MSPWALEIATTDENLRLEAQQMTKNFDGKIEEAVKLRYTAKQSIVKKAVAQMVPQWEKYKENFCWMYLTFFVLKIIF